MLLIKPIIARSVHSYVAMKSEFLFTKYLDLSTVQYALKFQIIVSSNSFIFLPKVFLICVTGFAKTFIVYLSNFSTLKIHKFC